MGDTPAPRHPLTVVGWISIAFGIAAISLAVQAYLPGLARGYAYARYLADDIAFAVLVVSAGVGLLTEVRWARAWALAVWGALLAEVICNGYWLGRFILRDLQDDGPFHFYRGALPQFGYDVACLLLGPFTVWKILAAPNPEGLRRRVLWAVFLAGLLISGVGNLYLLLLLREW